MRYTFTTFISFGIAAAASCASQKSTAQAEWQQCGGINWTGGTSCASGLTCVIQNPYYSQCLASSGVIASSASPLAHRASSSAASLHTSSVAVVASSSTIVPPIQPVASSSSKAPSSSSPSSVGSGTVYKSSFTHYGAGDSFGSPNCNTNTAACGFFTQPGFSAAVSQNLYGVGPGAGAGPACGTCWKLTGETDSSGNPLTNAGTSIIVMVNNLCPAAGNPLCSQSTLQDTNQYGANVNFDLCSDSGAEAAFFGNDGVGLAVGTAQQVDCGLYSGTVVH